MILWEPRCCHQTLVSITMTEYNFRFYSSSFSEHQPLLSCQQPLLLLHLSCPMQQALWVFANRKCTQQTSMHNGATKKLSRSRSRQKKWKQNPKSKYSLFPVSPSFLSFCPSVGSAPFPFSPLQLFGRCDRLAITLLLKSEHKFCTHVLLFL